MGGKPLDYFCYTIRVVAPDFAGRSAQGTEEMKTEKRPRVVCGLTEEQVDAMGYDVTRRLEDGTWLAAAQMTFNGRLFFNLDYHGFECCYCYKTLAEAVAAMNAFDPEKDEEPQGWFKDPMNNRIRPDGDASRETIGYPLPDYTTTKGETK